MFYDGLRSLAPKLTQQLLRRNVVISQKHQAVIPQICHFVQHLILFAVFGRYNRFRNFVAQLLQQLILTAAHEEFHLRIISLTLVQNHAVQFADNLRQAFYLRHRQIGRMPQRIMEAGIFTCMASYSLLLYLYEQRVTVAVVE